MLPSGHQTTCGGRQSPILYLLNLDILVESQVSDCLNLSFIENAEKLCSQTFYLFILGSEIGGPMLFNSGSDYRV